MTSVIISKKDNERIHRKESNVDTGIGEKTVEEAFRNLENEFMLDKIADEAFKQLVSEIGYTGYTGYTGLNVSEMQMIWDSWIQLNRSDLVDGGGTPPFAIHFLLWLFDNIPDMRDRFGKFDANQKDQDLLIGDEMFVSHARLVVGELYAIIKLLPEPNCGLVKRRIAELAGTHVQMLAPSDAGVGPKYFQPLHEKIHLFVSQRLGVPEEDEVCQLWGKLFLRLTDSVELREEIYNALQCQNDEEDMENEKKAQQKGCCLIL